MLQISSVVECLGWAPDSSYVFPATTAIWEHLEITGNLK